MFMNIESREHRVERNPPLQYVAYKPCKNIALYPGQRVLGATRKVIMEPLSSAAVLFYFWRHFRRANTKAKTFSGPAVSTRIIMRRAGGGGDICMVGGRSTAGTEVLWPYYVLCSLPGLYCPQTPPQKMKTFA